MRIVLLLVACLSPAWVADIRAETPSEKAERDARVEQRRAGVAIICHRGALEFAHENTLAAFRATFELGADGNEIDIRATKDGVLICFHDDMLEALLEAYGDAGDYSWEELQQFRFRSSGKSGQNCRIPTLKEVLLLHREHAGLLHLDVKRDGLDEGIVRLLDELDMWNHVIAGGAKCPLIANDPRFHPLPYQASLYSDRSEVDVPTLRRRFNRPGTAVIVEDPRGMLVALERKIGLPSEEPSRESKEARPSEGALSALPVESLLVRLKDIRDWKDAPEEAEAAQRSAQRITSRAQAIDELSRRGVDSMQLRELLRNRVRERSLHRHWRYHALDGAAALRALSIHVPQEAVPLLRFVLWRDDERLAAIVNPEYKTPSSWVDWRLKTLAFRLLRTIPSAASAQVCRDYLKLDAKAAEKLGPLQYEAAARALLAIRPQLATVRELHAHSRGEVRGRAILYAVAHADQAEFQSFLQDVAPHALKFVLPRPQRPLIDSIRPLRQLDSFSAAEAHQAVAVDEEHFYAIGSRSLGKYNKLTGALVKSWAAGVATKHVQHLNSGFVHQGKLYCGHSNWPRVPLKNSIEIWDTKTLQHLESRQIEVQNSAVTWIDRDRDSWWMCLANYGMEDEVRKTRLVRLDEDWNSVQEWSFPTEVVQRFVPFSCSGGSWGPDGLLYVTGHDRKEAYAVTVDPSEKVLLLRGVAPGGFAGQGICWDRTRPGILYGILRPQKEVVVTRWTPEG